MKKRLRSEQKSTYVTALLVGTALSALGAVPASASAAQTVHDMSRYCTVCWRNARLQPDHWSDCTQEVLARLLERVAPDRWEHVLKQESEERREFLRAIDTVKKRNQRAHRPGSLEVDVPDGRGVRSQALTDIRQSVLHAAEQSLTTRQFEIIRLTLDGWSVAEIAEQLDLPATRVSDEKYKAIQRLRDVLSERA